MRQPYYEDIKAGITIYCGDCREILPELPQVDLVLTDPPYNALNIGVDARTYDSTAKMKLPESEYNLFCEQWFSLAQQKSQGILVSVGIRNLWRYPPAKWVMIWQKPGAVAYNGTGGFNIWEPILAYGNVGHFTEDCYTSTPPNLLRGPEREHPCPKPIGLWKWLLLPSQNKAPVIMDPFMGSGTTLVAAKQLGRKATGIEISEKYCEIAVKRLAQEVMNFDVLPLVAEVKE